MSNPYGNLQTDKSQRLALEALVDGTSPSMALKQDAIIPANALGPGSVAQSVENVLGQSWREVSSTTALLITDRRVLAKSGCSLITMPAVGTFGNWFECTIINDSGGQLVIDGSGATNVTIEAGDIAVIIEANGKQRVSSGFSTVIS